MVLQVEMMLQWILVVVGSRGVVGFLVVVNSALGIFYKKNVQLFFLIFRHQMHFSN